MANNVKFKDFTQKKTDIRFKLDGREIRCYPKIKPDVLQELTDSTFELNLGNAKEKAAVFFSGVMADEDREHLVARLADPWDEFGVEEAMNIMVYLLECYGLRPTKSSSGKSAGSATGGDGTPSTDGHSAAA